MTSETIKRLELAARIAKLVLPLLPTGGITQVASALIGGGLSFADARRALAENHATPEQLAHLDAENERSVFDVIRERGGEIDEVASPDPTVPAPEPSPASIYDAAPVSYTDESQIPSDGDLLARGYVHGDDIGIAKPSTGSRTWKVFRWSDRDQTVEIGQALPQDKQRFVLFRTIA
jgi:hypothetical protein